MANQFYCKHCGKLIDADSAFCTHCGGEINSNSKSTLQPNKQDISFIRQLDILGGKFLIGIINIIKWSRTFLCLCKFVKKYHKILILIIGVALVALAILYCIDQEIEERGMLIIPAILLLIITLYFSYCRSIKIITTLGVLLVSSYSIFIYYEHKNIYGSSTTFFDTIKREFYWVTPNFTIPDHATEIKNGAFEYCELLSSVTIGNSVTSIGDNVFHGCYLLKSVIIPDSVISIGENSFFGNFRTIELHYKGDFSNWCKINFNHTFRGYPFRLFINGKEVSSIAIPSDITQIKDYLFWRCVSLKNVTISNSVTSIGEGAFGCCESLTSIDISDGVTSIGNRAFKRCSSLEYITIGKDVISIGYDAFADCPSLARIRISKSNTIYDSRNNCNAIISTSSNELVVGCKTTIIPKNIKSIGNSAFSGCTSLTSVTIPDSVISIGNGAFESCTSLTTITIPKRVKDIGWNAFVGCESLAYMDCKPIIPPMVYGEILGTNASNIKIYVPMEYVEAYQSADGWNEYAANIKPSLQDIVKQLCIP